MTLQTGLEKDDGTVMKDFIPRNGHVCHCQKTLARQELDCDKQFSNSRCEFHDVQGIKQ